MSKLQEGDGPRIAIIGSGFSGICLGIQLKKAGIRSFTIYEKSDRLGGTWRDNTYPGAACDVPAFAYCFSFELKTDWASKWAGQEELLAYMDHCAEKYGIVPHVRFGAEVVSAHFDANAALWRLGTRAGEEVEAEVLISAVGQLNRPKVPDIPGLGDFRGEQFHSARWNHEYELTGRRVAVIGNAASAIQFIPRIARQVEHLTVFQRSANWMIPRQDRAYSRKETERFGRHPWLARLYRWWIWGSYEVRYPLLFHAGSRLAPIFEGMAKKHMRSIITDRKLQAALVPDYPIGARRILISDDYYPALERKNVVVVTAGIDRIVEDGIVDREGRTHAADAIILATGFRSTDFLEPMEIRGLEGRSLEAEWKHGAHAYLGIAVSGFPNFFMAYGPNTNLGHNSIIFMIECQTRYILQCIEWLRKGDLAYLDLRPEVQAAFNTKLRAELRRTVWAETDHSWYKDEAGRIPNNWSGTTTRYWWKTRKVDLGCYRQIARTDMSGGRPADTDIQEKGRNAMRKGIFVTTVVLSMFTSICLADPVPDIREGQWEITTKLEMPGMPTGMPPVKNTQCLTDKDFVPENSQPGQECKFPETKVTGNTVTWTMECEGGGKKMKGTGSITYSGDTFKGTMKIQVPQENMEMISHMEGRRIGDCK